VHLEVVAMANLTLLFFSVEIFISLRQYPENMINVDSRLLLRMNILKFVLFIASPVCLFSAGDKISG